IPNLDNAAINLASLREQSQKELLTIIKNIRGKKCLVIDPKVSGSLSLIVQTALLKEHGVELRHLSAEPLQTECTKVVYLVCNQLEMMRHISLHIHDNTSKGLQREYYLYFVPRRSVACEQILKEEKVHDLLTIGEYPLYMVPLDEDVISFELDFAYKECLADADTSSLWHIAKAIHRLEVDMVTPMCTQLTYEGLLDELLHVNNGAVELDASIMGAQEGKKVKVPLNSSDKLFKETRDLNFEVVVQVLRQKATSMKQDYTDITTTNQTVSELKDFVKKLNSLPEMTRHINLAQHLSTLTSKPSFLGRLDMEHTIVESESYDISFEFIEEMIHKQEPLASVLRLLILFSVTNSGLPKRQFDYLSPNDISYVFSGYAPLSIRLIQQAIRSGWRSIEEILKLLPGPHLETKRGALSRGSSVESLSGGSANVDKAASGRRSVVLVVFVGGVTFAEISALRFLSSQELMAYDIIVATTKVINGQTLLDPFVERLS
uniref:Uncharacterized protein n=1 Tax=Chenopodium quinoa TaxID=63459 RepID=A0A803MWM7_CHEQI